MKRASFLFGLLLASCGSAPSEDSTAAKSCNIEQMSYVEVEEFLGDETHLTACSNDDDCVAFKGFCGGQDVAHRRDAECLAAAHGKLGQVIDCIRLEEAPFRPACVDKRCTKVPAE